ncbi:MAG: [FeFe] hydrogenase H-cluster radical SAM maturase HydE [Deltaproteobacteria bacterium HGW-Deltaproteobacteria-6]|nr:MAG: [FeFe] hydrogenase H-cluster radical SAM maturase HydE [Deltaproteobacteria bacterium HGW-Deltaproteobacteria-6]
MIEEEIITWLREEDERKLETLWSKANDTRIANVGDQVHLRGLIEISNICVRRCGYCGISADNSQIERYRMTEEEIMEYVHKAVDFGYGTVVMQAGEDYGITREWMANIIRRIKFETSLAVTLSLGERPDEDLIAWREAGANRYLIRFETSNRDLYDRIHPPLGEHPSDRFAILSNLKKLGYEVGSGIMIGIPGQTYEDLACDILAFRELDLDMIGVGPFIPHPETPLGQCLPEASANQVPNTEQMTYKVIALTRLVCPEANIPSTTALASLNKADGRELGLMRGANIVMPNLTPPQYRVMYEIYPNKACINETSEACASCLSMRILNIGRTVGSGQGGRLKRDTR